MEVTCRTTGRRKRSSARVFLSPVSEKEKATVVINKRLLNEYFSNELDQAVVLMPLSLLDKQNVYHIRAYVTGGGLTGQKEAIRHGISKALAELYPDDRPLLKGKNFLRRDPRRKERHKFGLRGRRAGSPFRKR